MLGLACAQSPVPSLPLLWQERSSAHHSPGTVSSRELSSTSPAWLSTGQI